MKIQAVQISQIRLHNTRVNIHKVYFPETQEMLEELKKLEVAAAVFGDCFDFSSPFNVKENFENYLISLFVYWRFEYQLVLFFIEVG